MRLIGLAFLALLLSVDVASADRGGRGRGRGGGWHGPPGRVVARDHRDHHDHYRRGPVRVVGGRYMFPGGVVRVYRRPVIRRYYDVHVRPAVIVEAYDPVPGYIWVAGSWRWGGTEWIWSPGYWQDDAPTTVVEPGISAGATFSAGVTIH